MSLFNSKNNFLKIIFLLKSEHRVQCKILKYVEHNYDLSFVTKSPNAQSVCLLFFLNKRKVR